MTTTSTIAALPTTDRGLSPIPFSRLARTELRKLVDTRAGRWLLIAIAALTPVVVAVMIAAVPTKDLTYNKFVDFAQTPMKLLLPALGALTMTSEWSQRTGLVTFTLEPRRNRVLRAKFAAALLLTLGLIAILFVVAAIGNILGQLIRNGDGSWSFGAAGFGEITLVLLIGLVQGLAFGMALLVTPAAVLLYYVLPSVWSALFSSASMKKTAPWFDLNQAGGALYNQQITATGWVQLLVAVAIWVGVPLAIGVVRVRRTEIK
ncbi:MAG: ABC transporter permease [Catenulispora sp.]